MIFPTQWHLIPIASGTKHPGSIVGGGWQHQASTDPQQITTWKQRHADCNWGLLLGSRSGVIDLEYDDDEGRDIIEAAVAKCGIQTVAYKSAKSVHRLFRFDERFTGLKAKESYNGTEWRFGDNKAQSVIPPSLHESGIQYEWLPGCSPDEIDVAILPEALWQLYERLRDEVKPAPAIAVATREHDGDGLIDVARNQTERDFEWSTLLQQHGWKLLRVRGEASDWTRPGKATGVSATLNFDGSGTLRVFSSNAGPLEPESSYDKFAFICSLLHGNDPVKAAKAILPDDILYARQAEWFKEQEANLPAVNLSGILDQVGCFENQMIVHGDDSEPEPDLNGPITIEQLKQLAARERLSSTKREEVEPLPRDVYDFAPGFLNWYIGHMMESSEYPLPESFLASALSLMAVITGRKVTDYRGTRTNLYCLLTAPTGCGKDFGRAKNEQILDAVAPSLRGDDDVASGQAIISALNENPAKLFQLDEMGQLLSASMGKSASPHMKQIVTNFTRLWTLSDKKNAQMRGFADREKAKSINQPHLCLYGTTTPNVMWDSLSQEQLETGFLGRVLLFEENYVMPKDGSYEPIPTHIMDFVKMWVETKTGGNLSDENPTPLVFKHADDAAERMKQHIHQIAAKRIAEDPVRAAIWSRAAEKTSKLALIAACAAFRTTIEVEDVEWAIMLSNALARRMCARVVGNISNSDYGKITNRIFNAIDQRGALKRSELTRSVKGAGIDRQVRGKAIMDLLEGEDVVSVTIHDGRRITDWYGVSYQSVVDRLTT